METRIENRENCECEDETVLRVKEMRATLTRFRGEDRSFPGVDLIYKISAKLKEKYGADILQYYLYHIMIGSSASRSECKFFDFSGEDSIESLLKEAVKELN